MIACHLYIPYLILEIPTLFMQIIASLFPPVDKTCRNTCPPLLFSLTRPQKNRFRLTEMNDTYYPEYDPTPFGGGFDQEEVYGKSHAPSEKSCYSPSHADYDLASLRDDDDDKLSVVSAYGVEIPHFDNAPHSALPEKSTTDSPPLAPEDHSQPRIEPLNDSQERSLPKPGERDPNSEGHWEPNYPVPEYHLRDSDRALCARCGMPLYCNCGCQIFSCYTSEDKEGACNQESPEDVADKVARWLFSSSYI